MRPAIQARRGAGLQARPVQAEGAQLIAQELRGGFAVAAAAIGHLADVRQAVQKCPGGDDDGAGVDGAAVAQQDSGDPAVGGE